MGASVVDDARTYHLFVRIRDRDEYAMAEFLEATKCSLSAYISRLIRDASTAEEVLQDTYRHIWVNASAYRPDRGSLGAWVYLIARSRAVDAFRRIRQRAQTQTLETCELKPSMADPHNEPAMAFDRAQLGNCIERLSPGHRELIRLAFFEGYTHAEIAVECGVPLGTVKTRIRSALSNLRKTARTPIARASIARYRRIDFGTPAVDAAGDAGDIFYTAGLQPGGDL